MELSLELVVWFIISLVLGTMVLYFILGVDYNGFYGSIKKTLTSEKDDRVMRGESINESIINSLEVWKSCGFGEIALNKTIFINETGTLNTEIYFNKIKELNLCSVISSNLYSCGSKEELLVGGITTPKIVQISCDPINKRLVIQ